MQNNVFRNSLVVGIIILFFGASVIPSMGNSIIVRYDLQGNKTTLKSINSRGYIQDLIDNASDGDTIYIPSGIYYENIVINKSISLVGEDKDTTIIDGSYSGDVVSIVTDWVNISGFTIQNSGYNWSAGINIGSNCNSITSNIISNNDYGISIWCEIHDNIIDNNKIYNCNCGLYLLWGSRCDPYGNIIVNNSFFNTGVVTGGYGCTQNFFFNNTVNGKPIVFLFDASDMLIDDDAGQIFLIKCDNITIKNQEISNTTIGIHIYGSDNCIIMDNLITNNKNDGIEQYFSDYSNFINNIVTNNYYSGIGLSDSDHNTIINNTVIKNGWGISVSRCFCSNIVNNTITNNKNLGISHHGNSSTISGNIITNNDNGIWLYHHNAHNINITNNNISNNGCGLWGEGSSWEYISNNTISNNIITNNDYGINLTYCDYNSIICNSFANNKNCINLKDSSSNNIINNKISNNVDGILLSNSNKNNITSNGISNNEVHGICVNQSYNNTISFNTIISNNKGIYLENSSNNTILKNNFLRNKLHAFFKNCTNIWNQNYWNRLRILPKLIFGTIEKNSKEFLWFNIDWHPAKEPYDIGV